MAQRVGRLGSLRKLMALRSRIDSAGPVFVRGKDPALLIQRSLENRFVSEHLYHHPLERMYDQLHMTMMPCKSGCERPGRTRFPSRDAAENKIIQLSSCLLLRMYISPHSNLRPRGI